jgi:NAD(P)-dependent dehydrogenase (short-subunit alcohol dehydrogenase family)
MTGPAARPGPTTVRFAGRRAIVTGASRGIGAGVAVRLAAEGADVAIVARTLDHHPSLPGSLRATAARMAPFGGRVVTVVADLSDDDDRGRVVPEAVAGLGGPADILVNNAAAAIYQPLADFPLRRRLLTFALNVEAPLDLMQAVLPSMRAAGRGWIVNLSSATARPRPGPPFVKGAPPTMAVYGASKAALNRLTNALADEVWGEGIRVNTVEPRAAVMTEGATALIGDMAEDRIESLETMVEAAVALCDCPAERTGQVVVSLDLLAALDRPVLSLDARQTMASPPAGSEPEPSSA